MSTRRVSLTEKERVRLANLLYSDLIRLDNDKYEYEIVNENYEIERKFITRLLDKLER